MTDVLTAAASATETDRTIREELRHLDPLAVNLAVGQCVRQGDVLIQRVDTLPAGQPRGRRDLAPGSAHDHIAEDPAETFDLPSGRIGIRSAGNFLVSHANPASPHRTILLPAGDYIAWRQVEADAVRVGWEWKTRRVVVRD